MAIQNYQDLKVWQRSKELAKEIFRLTYDFPKEQQYVLVSQMQRSALSIPSNIAEGRSRHSKNDFIYHLNVAKGSLAELETQIIIAYELNFIQKSNADIILVECSEITRMLYGLKDSLTQPKSYNLKPVT